MLKEVMKKIQKACRFARISMEVWKCDVWSSKIGYKIDDGKDAWLMELHFGFKSKSKDDIAVA